MGSKERGQFVRTVYPEGGAARENSETKAVTNPNETQELDAVVLAPGLVLAIEGTDDDETQEADAVARPAYLVKDGKPVISKRDLNEDAEEIIPSGKPDSVTWY